MTAVTPTYTQADLDADIRGIEVDLEDAMLRITRIREGWPHVQALHPGVTADEYIKAQVPFLHQNTAAAVALVVSGGMTVADAARVTGRTRKTIAGHLSKTTQIPKPKTLATGKTAPGPRVGTTIKAMQAQTREQLGVAPPGPRKTTKRDPAAAAQNKRTREAIAQLKQQVTRPAGSSSAVVVDTRAQTWERFVNFFISQVTPHTQCGDPNVEAKAKSVIQCLDANR